MNEMSEDRRGKPPNYILLAFRVLTLFLFSDALAVLKWFEEMGAM